MQIETDIWFNCLISQDIFEFVWSKELILTKTLKKRIVFQLFFSEECSSKNGQQDGSCASGFGVCCVCKYET